MLENSGLPVERMPGLAAALEGFIAAAPKSLARLDAATLWTAARSSRPSRRRSFRR